MELKQDCCYLARTLSYEVGLGKWEARARSMVERGGGGRGRGRGRVNLM